MACFENKIHISSGITQLHILIIWTAFLLHVRKWVLGFWILRYSALTAVEFPTQYANHRPESEAHTVPHSRSVRNLSLLFKWHNCHIKAARECQVFITWIKANTGGFTYQCERKSFPFSFSGVFSILQWSSNRRIKKHNQCHNFTEPEGYFGLFKSS